MDSAGNMPDVDDALDATPDAGSTVYVDPSTHIIYDALMIFVDVSTNVNKFCHLQLLSLPRL